MQISNFILGVVTNKTYDNFWPNFSHFFGLVQKIGEFSFFFLGVFGKENKKKFFTSVTHGMAPECQEPLKNFF